MIISQITKTKKNNQEKQEKPWQIEEKTKQEKPRRKNIKKKKKLKEKTPEKQRTI